MQKTELVLFNDEETGELISNIDIRTKTTDGKTYLLDDDGFIRCCDSCQRKLELKKVGSIAHGSRKIFCDNPLCLSSWIAQNKI